MRKVLVAASTVKCGPKGSSHQGTVKTKGVARLLINGSGALTTASVLPDPPATTSVEGCGNESGGPCSKLLKITKGTSTRLTVDGASVLLDSLVAATDKSPAAGVDPKSINNDLLNAD